MVLTDEEKRMLAGEDGEAISLSMGLLVKFGEVFGAERMVPVRSAHIACSYPEFISAVEVREKFAQLGAKFRTMTTVNPVVNPDYFDRWKDLPEPEELKRNSVRQIKALEKMGVIPNWSCTPYFQGNLPRLGECVSWVESSAIIFANSVLGARTNRTTLGIDLASAITGKAPQFGLLLEENRAGNVLVQVEYKPRGLFDYHTTGYIIGKQCAGKVPVIEGLPPETTANELKVMGAAAAIRGGIALFHAVGITPEARSKEEALRGKKPEFEVRIEKSDVKLAIEELNTIKGGKIDAVLVGCPHPTVEEVRELALLLEGKRVREDVKFFLYASGDVIHYACRMGYVQAIEAAGVRIFEGECITSHQTAAWGWKNIATDSAKFATTLPGDPTCFDVLYADTKKCVDLATL